jgi:hypothetical protein
MDKRIERKYLKKQRLIHDTRRQFLGQVIGAGAGFGIGSAALSMLLDQRLSAETLPQSVGRHPFDFAPKAKSVIYLQQCGGPSHVDLFDYKPELLKRDGQLTPESLIKGERFAFITGTPKLSKSPFSFKPHGESGAMLCELMPGLGSVVDDVAFIRSMTTTQFNHGPAQIFQITGHQIPGRPTFGSWLSYGIGSEGKDLPAYVVLLSGHANPDGGASCWSCGFLPTVHQGVTFQKTGDPVNFVSNPPGVTAQSRRESLDLIHEMNQEELQSVGDPEISTRISAYELAYKMQSSVPGLMDVASEPAAIHEMYGTTPGQPSYANNCLLARRLVERGVRFVQLCHRNWDMHGVNYNEDIVNHIPVCCNETDRGSSALIKDLKQRGLLDTTLVIWAGEFGRTPMRQPAPFFGRDHHPKGYTIWMAGGGIKPGFSLGETDEFGYNAVVDRVSPYDINATALRLLGIDHTKLTYRFQGRNFRLTDVAGEVISKLIV